MLQAIVQYCSQADMERLLSTAGVIAGADHDADGALNTMEQLVINDVINLASETINYYLYNLYDPANLATSNLVNRWSTILACYELKGERANPEPTTLTDWAADAEDKLQAIYDHRHYLPGIPLRRTFAPTWDIVRVDPRFSFKCLRVERNRSSQQPNALPVVPDYSDLWSYEL
jgi:hypothetical protein